MVFHVHESFTFCIPIVSYIVGLQNVQRYDLIVPYISDVQMVSFQCVTGNIEKLNQNPNVYVAGDQKSSSPDCLL
jgi:hypothetical protein